MGAYEGPKPNPLASDGGKSYNVAFNLRPPSVGNNQAKAQERMNECSRPRRLYNNRKYIVFESLRRDQGGWMIQ